jgi:hypothetical protein
MSPKNSLYYKVYIANNLKHNVPDSLVTFKIACVRRYRYDDVSNDVTQCHIGYPIVTTEVIESHYEQWGHIGMDIDGPT